VAASAAEKPVALIIAQGGLGDKSYNDLAYSGFKKALAEYKRKESRSSRKTSSRKHLTFCAALQTPDSASSSILNIRAATR